jgi:hypothetical protein
MRLLLSKVAYPDNHIESDNNQYVQHESGFITNMHHQELDNTKIYLFFSSLLYIVLIFFYNYENNWQYIKIEDSTE